MDRFEVYGIFSGVVGIILSVYGFYLIGNTILESAGIAFLIVGLAFVLTVPEEPSKGISVLLKETTNSLEEYFTSKLSAGYSIVYEPRENGIAAIATEKNDHTEQDVESNNDIEQSAKNQQSLEFTPVGATFASKVKKGDDYTSTLKRILVDEAAVASGCDALLDLDGGYRVLIQEPVTLFLEANPSADEKKNPERRQFDSPLAQVCAAVFARCSGEKVVVKQDGAEGRSKRILLGFA
jgi:hypothetical protein